MDCSKPIVLTRDTPQAESIVRGIGHLHAHCILDDGTMATFIPPLSASKLTTFWQNYMHDVEQGLKRIIVQLLPVSSRTGQRPEPIFAADSTTPVPAPQITFGLSQDPYEVAGVVVLDKPFSETGPFRASILKLFVSPNHRRRGVAKAVVAELENQARRDGRWSLLLDTTVGSPAEHVYPKLGFIKVGYVPEYGLLPKDGTLADEIWFWKDLRKSQPL